jgi:MFS family permease
VCVSISLLIITLLYHTLLSTVPALLPMYAVQNHKFISKSDIEAVISSKYLIELLFSPAIGIYSDSIGRRNMLQGGLNLVVLSTIVFGMAGLFSDSRYFFAISMSARLFQGLSMAALNCMTRSLIFQLSKSQAQAVMFLGFYLAMTVIANTCGPHLATYCLSKVGYTEVFCY